MCVGVCCVASVVKDSVFSLELVSLLVKYTLRLFYLHNYDTNEI